MTFILKAVIIKHVSFFCPRQLNIQNALLCLQKNDRYAYEWMIRVRISIPSIMSPSGGISVITLHALIYFTIFWMWVYKKVWLKHTYDAFTQAEIQLHCDAGHDNSAVKIVAQEHWQNLTNDWSILKAEAMSTFTKQTVKVQLLFFMDEKQKESEPSTWISLGVPVKSPLDRWKQLIKRPCLWSRSTPFEPADKKKTDKTNFVQAKMCNTIANVFTGLSLTVTGW